MRTEHEPGARLEEYGLPGGTSVMTPAGWRRLQGLMPGDQVVDANGHVASVTRMVRCGVGRAAELRLTDGSSLTAGLRQEWDVELGTGDRVRRATLTTLELAERLAAGDRPRLVPLEPLELGGGSPPALSGYVVGCLIGDGGLTGDTPVLWSSESEIVERVRGLLPPGNRLTARRRHRAQCPGWALTATSRGCNPATEALRDWGLMGRHSFEKHIPAELLWAPKEYRLALVRGLFDSDGSADKDGRITFNTASELLIADVVALIRGLGGRTSPVSCRRTVYYTAHGSAVRVPARPSYRIGVFLPAPAFLLSRKAARTGKPRSTTYWTIASVHESASASLCTLQLDSPGASIVAGDYVPVRSAPATAEYVPAVRPAA